ncbi:hypothetical protein D3C85_1603010 [compost metagenome]
MEDGYLEKCDAPVGGSETWSAQQNVKLKEPHSKIQTGYQTWSPVRSGNPRSLLSGSLQEPCVRL